MGSDPTLLQWSNPLSVPIGKQRIKLTTPSINTEGTFTELQH